MLSEPWKYDEEGWVAIDAGYKVLPRTFTDKALMEVLHRLERIEAFVTAYKPLNDVSWDPFRQLQLQVTGAPSTPPTAPTPPPPTTDLGSPHTDDPIPTEEQVEGSPTPTETPEG